MSKEKNLGEFIQAVNKEVISTIISKQTNPLKPDKQFTCLMQDVRAQLDVNVTSEGKVTDGEGVAASLHLEYGYVPMLPREQVKPGSVPPKESGTGEGGVKASDLRDDEDDVSEAVGKLLFEEPQGVFILTRGLSGEAKRQLLKGMNDLVAPLLDQAVPANGQSSTNQ